jgi:autotransporter-associated beta strand protein
MTVALLLLAGVASAVTWINGVAGDYSWDAGANWVDGSKPTSAQEAYWTNLTSAYTIYLDDNQACASLRVRSQTSNTATLTLNGTDRVEPIGPDFYLRFETGDIAITQTSSKTQVLTLRAPILLGDNLAVWDTSTPSHTINVYKAVSETVSPTTIKKIGTSTTSSAGLNLYAPLNITGSLWIAQGASAAGTGSNIITAGGPTHNIKLGDDTGSANATFTMAGGSTNYANFVIMAGSLGTRTISVGHTYTGGTYIGNFLLNADLTISGYGPTKIATGTWSGTGGVVKNGSYIAGMTGPLTYTGDTTVNAGSLVITGNTTGGTGMGDFLIKGSFYSGTTIKLASDAIFEVDNGGSLYPGNPTESASPFRTITDNRGTLTIQGDLVLRELATLVFQMAADTTAGTTYDTIVLGSDLTLDGTLAVTQISGFNTTNGVYQIIDYGAGTLTNNGLIVTGVTGDYWIDTWQVPGKVILRTGQTEQFPPEPVVPEPGTWLLVGTGALGLFGYLRRRRMK